MTKKNQDLLFEVELEEDSSIDSLPESDRRLVTMAYDFIVKSLKDQIADNTIIVDETWQRKYVWDDAKASRLIESLLLNVPIPVCYFAEEEKSGQYLVIDGQQRLWSIYRFLNNEFSLKGLHVLAHLNDKRFYQLETRDQRLISTRGIRCIVLTQECHPELRFDVFERLNYGSVPLTPQEIRHCMYRGDLNNLLAKLCTDKNWLKCLDKKEPDERLRDQELILRFLAFHFNLRSYRPPLKNFFNDFMRANRKMQPELVEEFTKLFVKSTKNVYQLFGIRTFRRLSKKNGVATWDKQINKALFDLQFLLASFINEKISDELQHAIVKVFEELMLDDNFVDLIVRATDHKSRVQQRFAMLCDKLKTADIIIEPLFSHVYDLSI